MAIREDQRQGPSTLHSSCNDRRWIHRLSFGRFCGQWKSAFRLRDTYLRGTSFPFSSTYEKWTINYYITLHSKQEGNRRLSFSKYTTMAIHWRWNVGRKLDIDGFRFSVGQNHMNWKAYSTFSWQDLFNTTDPNKRQGITILKAFLILYLWNKSQFYYNLIGTPFIL